MAERLPSRDEIGAWGIAAGVCLAFSGMFSWGANVADRAADSAAQELANTQPSAVETMPSMQQTDVLYSNTETYTDLQYQVAQNRRQHTADSIAATVFLGLAGSFVMGGVAAATRKPSEDM